jgi:ABC-type uncharacterized transport system substrate-binding protein
VHRRQFLFAVALSALAVPLAAWAQSTVTRIGYLWSGPRGSDPTETGGLRQGLRDLGYVEGQNIVIEYRYAEGNLDRVPRLLAELINLKVAVLVTPGTPVTAAAKRGAGTTPVVSVSNDPVGSGFVQSLARPGGTITGLSFGADAGFSGKWLELVRETAPTASRVGIIWNPTNRSNAAVVEEMKVLASKLGLQFSAPAVRSPADIDAAFTALTRARVGALIIATDPFITAQRAQVMKLAAASGIPTVSSLRYFVDSGGLMAYGPSLFDLFRRAALYVDKILKGAKPADLPVEQPTKFELIVNLKTAKALGLTIPQSLLLRADEVIR